jgi:DNA-binding response OmpR family regulator
MTPATVLLVGADELATIPDYLRLGAVVVVAPDRVTLRRWQRDTEDLEAGAREVDSDGAVIVDFPGRRVLLEGVPLDLTELEFRILAALLARPGRAWSFQDLRMAGWGDGPELAGDVEALRALVQRIRRKLEARGSGVRIEAVRGYGFRGTVSHPARAANLRVTRGSA